MEISVRLVKTGSCRKEIKIMLGNDSRSKMPTAPISFYERLSLFWKKDANRADIFPRRTFPFFNRPKKSENVQTGKHILFHACSKLSARMKIKNANFSRRVAFLKKPLCQQFLAFKCSKLSQNFPLKEITGRLSNVKV